MNAITLCLAILFSFVGTSSAQLCSNLNGCEQCVTANISCHFCIQDSGSFCTDKTTPAEAGCTQSSEEYPAKLIGPEDPSQCFGGCATFESCDECANFGTICGWCYTTSRCTAYSKSNSGVITIKGENCPEKYFLIPDPAKPEMTCQLKCPEREGCTSCFATDGCKFCPTDSVGNQGSCMNAADASEECFASIDKCPVPASGAALLELCVHFTILVHTIFMIV